MKLNVGGLIKKVLFMLCLTGLFGGLVEAAAETNAIKSVVYDGLYILGQCNKTTPFYRVGQKAVLTLSALDHRGDKSVDLSNHTLRILRQGEDGKDFEKTIQFVELPWSIDERMEKPGFIRIRADLFDEQGKPCRYNEDYCGSDRPFFDGSLAFGVDQLKSVTEPGDFDEFWAQQRTRLSHVPILAHRMEILQDQTNLPHRVYAVEVTCQGAFPVTGYLYIPRGAETRGKKYPICVGYSEHGIEVPSCESGKINPKFREFIFFHVNAHGVKLREFGGDEQSAELHKWLVARDEVLAFNQNENYSKNLSYFSGMALRVMRAQDYVKTLPEWNGIDLWVEGSSHGGLQAIWAAALDSTVTRLTTRMTWGCDWGGQTVGRLQGSLKPKWTTTLGYFDAVNHAKRIRKRCSVEITKAGLGDMMCPPSGLAILWNNLSCPKKIVWVQGATHEYSPIAFKEMYEVIWEKK